MSPPRIGDAAEIEALATRLENGPALVLDGALGTELERRGVTATLPLWSAHALLEAPDVVRAIHRDYARAGAEILTANTFRTQRRTLARAGRGDRARELTAVAVALAREAARGSGLFVAGSAPPLEDCYRPDRVPDADACEREHREHAENLARAGVDLVIVETMNTAREARAAAEAARAAGLACVVSFVCDDRARLLSGEPLAAALDAVRDAGPCAVGVNCVPPDTLDACLPALAREREAHGIPLCVYANLGAPLPDGAFRTHFLAPEALARRVGAWLEAGARIVGGCCGTTPEHTAAMARVVRADRGSGPDATPPARAR